MANNITVLQALDMISEATKQYVDDVSFSGDFKDLTNKPDILIDTTQATDDQVAKVLIDIFGK